MKNALISVGFFLIAGAIWFKPTLPPQLLRVDITDREKGICSGMYREGFDWGLGQVSLFIAERRIEGKTESEIRELLYIWAVNLKH